MHQRIAIAYNEPTPSLYGTLGEEKAVLGVLQAVEAVHQALLELGDDVFLVPLAPPPQQLRRQLKNLKADLVFNLFEGFCGDPSTEALLPPILSENGIPYTGCSGTTLRLALDKSRVKVLLKAAGIPTPDFQLLTPDTLHLFHLRYPCIVKPRGEDASHGISEQSVVHDPSGLARQIQMVSQTYRDGALVEEFITGREFNATVLGNEQYTVLPVSEIVYSLPAGLPPVLTFAAKWEPDSLYFRETKVVCPASLVPEEQKTVAETALAAFRLTGCRNYARVDMRRDQKGQLNVIEVNPNPDISPDTGAARQAKAAGMTYTQFIERIVKLALEGEIECDEDSPYDPRRQTPSDDHPGQHTRIQAV